MFIVIDGKKHVSITWDTERNMLNVIPGTERNVLIKPGIKKHVQHYLESNLSTLTWDTERNHVEHYLYTYLVTK